MRPFVQRNNPVARTERCEIPSPSIHECNPDVASLYRALRFLTHIRHSSAAGLGRCHA
jgi:hypothetical protein